MRLMTGEGAAARRRAGRRLAACAVVAIASIAAPALTPASASASAGFGRLSGRGGCLVAPGSASSDQATQGCGEGKGLAGPSAVAVSPDGANVYVTAGSTNGTVASSFGSVAILSRDPATGAISETGCLSSDGTDGRDGASGACTPTPSLLGADGVAVSPDGLSVFVTSSYSGSVVAFARTPANGSLTRLGCLQYRPVGGSQCRFADVFMGSSALATSADGRSLYIAAPAIGGVSTLTSAASESGAGAATSATPGEAPSLASIFGVPGTPFLANPCIAVNGFDGACAVGVATQGIGSLALSPDGKQLYGTAPLSNALDVFTPDAAGVLAESSCLKVSPPPGLCKAGKLMSTPTRPAISPDGRNVYAADSSAGQGKVDLFTREATSGALTELGCVDYLPPPRHPDKEEEEEEKEEGGEQHESTPADPCTSVPGLQGVDVVAVSGDGSAVYAIGGSSAAILSRDPSTGKLSEASCAAAEDSRCTSMPTLSGVDGEALSPDGREVYVTARGSNAVMVFGIGAAVTSARTSASRAGVARVLVSCPAGLRRACTGRVRLLRSHLRRSAHGGRHGVVTRIGAGGSTGFAIRPGRRATVSVRLSPAFRRLLLQRRRLRLMAVVLARPSAGGSGYGRRVTLRLGR